MGLKCHVCKKLHEQVEDIWEQLDTINKRLKNRNPHRPQYDGEPTDGMIGRPMSKAASQRGAGLFEITTTAVIAVLVVYWYHGNQDISTLVRKSEPVAAPKRNVAFSFEGIEDLVTKARFNKRDMLLSKQMLMEQYKVKLGIGASLSSSGSEVKLWVSAIVNKDDENDWPIGEVLKLTLNHADPQKKRSYEFLSSHTGTWKESIRVHKATLLFRQIQVDSTKYQKYLRFSCLLNYEEALAAGYIDKDRVTVELSVII
ncbi:hypothetical protein BIW11_05631 [Tropilaelaps mercedesae]|uniref:Uncharacterized protein n=1 Tax=Tropilaelaps mercedesae TaxID=418985 RepID=A0A1V9Y1L1_9ACAR|nr:hypothetical protein BIW11_05631 [Tropilaelaps mercedesae]